MLHLLFAEGTNFSSVILPIILIVLVVLYIGWGFIKRAKYSSEAQNIMNNLQVGTKIKTIAGVYGEIVEIRDALDGSKVALIRTGEEDKVSYMSIDLSSVYGVDEKDNIELFGPESEETDVKVSENNNDDMTTVK